MKTIALLTPRLLQRVRSAVSPPALLSARTHAIEVVDALRSGWPDVAVLDPTLVDEPGNLVWPLRDAHVGTVLYVYLTREHLIAAIRLGEHLSVQILTYGYNDDLLTLRRVLDCRGRAARGEVLLLALSPRLAWLPRGTQAGIHAANQREPDLHSGRQLTPYCHISRHALATQLHRAGLGSVHNLITALQLVRSYDVISDNDVSMSMAARLVGVSSTRALDRQCRAVSGARIADIRSGLSIGYFCDAIVKQLRLLVKE